MFIVTDAEESFGALSDEVRGALLEDNPELHLSQLYRDYLVNFMINKRPRTFSQIGFVMPEDFRVPPDTPTADRDKLQRRITKAKKQLVNMIEGLPQSQVTDGCRFVVSEKHKASILFDPEAAGEWLEALDDQNHITEFYICSLSCRSMISRSLIGTMPVSEPTIKRPSLVTE